MSGDDSRTSMERFEELGRKLFRVAKEDLEKAEREAKEIVDDAIGPPPAEAPAIEPEE